MGIATDIYIPIYACNEVEKEILITDVDGVILESAPEFCGFLKRLGAEYSSHRNIEAGIIDEQRLLDIRKLATSPEDYALLCMVQSGEIDVSEAENIRKSISAKEKDRAKKLAREVRLEMKTEMGEDYFRLTTPFEKYAEFMERFRNGVGKVAYCTHRDLDSLKEVLDFHNIPNDQDIFLTAEQGYDKKEKVRKIMGENVERAIFIDDEPEQLKQISRLNDPRIKQYQATWSKFYSPEEISVNNFPTKLKLSDLGNLLQNGN